MPRYHQLPDSGVMQFSQIVKIAVDHSGLSLREFAKKVGVTQSVFTNWLGNLKAQPGEALSAPNLSSFVLLSDYILNPKTGKAFAPSELFAVCTGEVSYAPEELDKVESLLPVEQEPDVQSDAVEQNSDQDLDVKQVYWDQIIVPGVEKMLDAFGEKQKDGSLFFSSKEYTYTRDPSGELTITPKNGRPPLSPSNMKQRDLQVMTAIAKKMQDSEQSQKTQQSVQRSGKMKI